MTWAYEDLKAFAVAGCINVFKDFTKEEINQESKNIQDIWEIGEAFFNADYEEQS